MVVPEIVTTDARGGETSRPLTAQEIVIVHYDHNPEAGSMVDVEAPPAEYPGDRFKLRVNLNDGVALLFDAPDDVGYLLTEIRDAVNVAVEYRRLRQAVS